MPKKIAIARPRSLTGKASRTIASAAGNMIAAPAPWTMRKKISQASAPEPVGVAPQRAEGTAKTITPTITMRRVPGHSGEPAAEGEERREREQVAVDDPLRPGGREVDVFLDRRQRDRDDRLVDEGHRDGEDHRREDQFRVFCGSRRHSW